jgi:pyruvate dehydrogenase E2 component (dihydrolipoamide acetyltransferase)
LAIEVVLPRLGWDMEEGSLVEWFKHDGDTVNVGDAICSIEGDKAVNEVESMDAGILRIPPDSPTAGTKVPVGTVLAYLVKPDEVAPFEKGTPPVRAASPEVARLGTAGGVATETVASAANDSTTARPGGPRAEPAISPRARRIAAEVGVEWAALAGTGKTGRIVERDIRQAASAQAEAAASAARISPVARRAAEAAGVDVDALARARPGQRITREDVEAAAREVARAAPTPVAPAPATVRTTAAVQSADATRTPMSGIRRLIASRLSESAHTTAPVTLTTEADATDLVRFREQLKLDLQGSNQTLPAYNDLLARLLAVALRDHPALNASLDGNEIVQHAAVHLGFAVDTDRGLLVPVVRDVQRKSVADVARESAHLVEQARAGTISASDLNGATFTITNLGMYDVDAFTPIVNLPNCAILGVGRIQAKPVVVDEASERIAVRKMLTLSLTFDHRLVDGAPAARFLQQVKHFIEHPTAWLIR